MNTLNTLMNHSRAHRTGWFVLLLAGLVLGGCAASGSRSDPFARGEDREPTPRTLHMMSRVLIAQSQPDRAEYVLRNLIGQHEGYSPAYVELARLLAATGRGDEAEGVLERGIERTPGDPVLLNNLGVLRLRTADVDAAAEAFAGAVESSPGEARYVSNLALARGMQGRAEESLALYLRVVPEAEARWNVATALENAGDRAGALAAYAAAHELDPELGADAEAARLRTLLADLAAVPTGGSVNGPED